MPTPAPAGVNPAPSGVFIDARGYKHVKGAKFGFVAPVKSRSNGYGTVGVNENFLFTPYHALPGRVDMSLAHGLASAFGLSSAKHDEL